MDFFCKVSNFTGSKFNLKIMVRIEIKGRRLVANRNPRTLEVWPSSFWMNFWQTNPKTLVRYSLYFNKT